MSVIRDFFGIEEPVKRPVEKKTGKITVYVGVNSDDTAIISLVPLVRWENEKQSNDAGYAYSYDDTQRPPHWIPQDERPHQTKWGHAYIGEYVNVNRAFVTKLTGLDMDWDDNFLTIEI